MIAGSLEARADSGDAEAQLALARRCDAESNVAGARAWFARAAKSGRIDALRELGLNLLAREPYQDKPGVNMIRAAADGGDAEAAHLCAILAAGDEKLADRWAIARQCLEIAAERGWTFAQEQLDFLKRADLDFGAALPAKRTAFEKPRIEVIEGFASPAECEWLIARARPHLKPATVYDSLTGGSQIESARTNSSAEFGLALSDIVLKYLRARIMAITAVKDLEGSAVLHYAPGQEFKPHYDFLDAGKPGFARDIEKRGQRVATFLIYLNEGFEGGETAFPKLDWSYKGKPGDALLFWNVDPWGVPDQLTFHAGLPTTKGEKWLFSQWMRRRV